MPSFAMVSFLSIMPSVFFILSDEWDIASVFLSILSILVSFDIGFMASSANAAGAKAKPITIIAAKSGLHDYPPWENNGASHCYQESRTHPHQVSVDLSHRDLTAS